MNPFLRQKRGERGFQRQEKAQRRKATTREKHKEDTNHGIGKRKAKLGLPVITTLLSRVIIPPSFSSDDEGSD
jgi:hypothetical protein